MYLDTGCSNGSFTKDKPSINFKKDTGIVETANNSYSSIEGRGTIRIGSVEVDTKWVPSFQKNLINDSDVLKNNKYIIIGKNRFAVLGSDANLSLDASSVTATGTRQHDELLSFDNQIDKDAINSLSNQGCNMVEQNQEPGSMSTSINLHRSLGHAGKSWINRTIYNEGALGLPKRNIELSSLCEICETTKGRQGKIPRTSNTKYLPGEAFSMDSQGPFRTIAHDGTTSNMKIIDMGSGYIEYSTVQGATANESLSLFNSFSAKMERRTNRKVKYVYTDDGKEFLGSFLQRLDELGIVKRKGLPYDHHNPGKIERAHQTIMQLGRAMHKESKLPRKYYPLCHTTAVYISNRLVHSTESKTPYELINDRKPDLSYIAPFGSICFATLSPEKRDGKLSDTGFKGRLVGYGDDDGLEEVKGYHILRESDQSLHWVSRRNTKMDLETSITNLPGTTEQELYDDGEDILGDLYYSPNENEDENQNEILEEESLPSGTTAQDNQDDGNSEETEAPIPQIEPQHHYNTRSRRLAMIPSEINQIRSELEENTTSIHSPNNEDNSSDEEWFDANNDSHSSNHSWFNPAAPHAKFRVHFARGAAKLGISPDLLFATFAAIQDGVATSYDQAMKSTEKDLYIAAMQAEVEGMKSQKVYELAEIPEGRKSIKGKWVFRKKFDMFGKLIKIKARWVAKGFTQIHGQDYFETFAAVAKLKSVRTFLAIASALSLRVYQHDVPQAFLGTPLEEELWIDQIQGFEDGTTMKCRLHKTLYGLKQSPREFNKSVHSFITENGFTQCIQDSCIYYKREGNKVIYFLLYVDDCLISGNDSSFTVNFQEKYKKHFKIVESTSPAEWFLGLHIERSNTGSYSINQNQYVRDKLKEFETVVGLGKASQVLPNNLNELLDKAEKSDQVEPDFPYRNMVGSLMYAMTGTRFDIAFAISIVSKFLANPKKIHCDLVRHIFKYLRGNPEFYIRYKPGKVLLECFADAAYANHLEYRSTLGHCITINGIIVDWSSKAQKGAPAQSSSEAEYMSATSAANNVVWFRQFLQELGFKQEITTIYEDNEACIKLSKNPQDHSRTKHIQVRYHTIRQYVEDGIIQLIYIPTKSQLADLLTKCLPGSTLRTLVGALSQGGN
jgi:hypothetical protein